MYSFESLIYFISIVANFVLGIFVLRKGRRDEINRTFFASVVSANGWLISLVLYYYLDLPEYILLIGRINFALVLPILYYLLKFAIIFPTKIIEEAKFRRIRYFLSAFFIVLIALTIFTPLVDKDEIITGVRQRETVYGELYSFYILTYFFFSFLVAGTLFYKLKKYKKDIEKTQIKYVLFGLSLALIFGFVTNIVFPYFGLFDVANYGPLATLIFTVFMTIAIARHHLFDIKVVLVEILVTVIAFILLAQAWLGVDLGMKILSSIVFILFCIFGYYLIRATIEEIKRREQIEKISKELEAAYVELEKLDKAKSEFISIASHQLRTPLTAIKGYVALIEEKVYGAIPAKMNKPLNNIFSSVERLIKLVNDLLSVSRIEAGRIKVEPEEFFMEDLITSIMAELNNLASMKKLYLKWEKPKKPCPKVYLDRGKIRQVILNLIDNAIKYTTQGGITVEYGHKNGTCEIVISDTGAGMERTEIEKLFKTFSRGAAGRKAWPEGTGLGLYIAKKFTEMHNGSIKVESAGKGKGSVFRIEIPKRYEQGSKSQN